MGAKKASIAMISASSLGRIAACPASEALPHASRETEWSSAGTTIHAFLEACSTVGLAAALESVPAEYHDACAVIALENLPHGKPGSYASEVAFAFSVDTFECRELGRNLKRDYASAGLKPNEIAGSADVIGLTENGVVIADIKTGYQFQAADSWQMRFLGMAAALTYDKQEAHLLTLIVHDDDVMTLHHHLSAVDFGSIAMEIAEVLNKVGMAKQLAVTKNLNALPFTTGPHCRYCPAFAYCPAQVSLIKDLVRDDTPNAMTAADIAAALTTTQAAAAWTKLKAAENVVDRLKEAIKLYALNNDVALPNGMVLGVVEREVESLDGGVVHRVVTARHGKDVADTVVTMEATKAAIKEAVRKIAAGTGGKMSHLEKAILDDVRDLKGSKIKTSRQVREHAPRKVVA